MLWGLADFRPVLLDFLRQRRLHPVHLVSSTPGSQAVRVATVGQC